MPNKYAYKYSVALIRESRLSYPLDEQLGHSAHAARVLWSQLNTTDREHCVLLFLDQKHRINGYHTLSIGSHKAGIVSPRMVFKLALVSEAAALIIGHNHPSGDPTPSSEDRVITHRLVEAGKLLDVPVLDHVIVGSGTENLRYFSFADAGILEKVS